MAKSVPFLACTILLTISANVQSADAIWKIFHAGSSGLPGDIVTALACDSLGNIWVGTDSKGVGMFNGVEWVSYRGGDDQMQSIVSSIAVTPHGDVFIGYNGLGGVGTVSKKIFSLHTKHDVDLPGSNVQHVASDRKNNVWIATTRGLGECTAAGDWRVEKDADLPSKELAAVAADRAGHVWMSFVGKTGLAFFDGRTTTYFNEENSRFPETAVTDLAVDDAGAVWAATDKNGIVKFENGIVTQFTTDNCGIPSNKAYALALAPGGRIWVATAAGGAFFDGQHWTAFTQENSSLPSNQVFSVVADRHGRGWFGTQDGLARVILTGE